VRSANHGDTTLTRGSPGFLNFREPGNEEVFTPASMSRVEAWVQEHGGKMSAYIRSGNIQLTALEYSSVGRPQFISTFFIDPATYPPPDDIRAIDPAGVRLGDLFQGGDEVVVSQNLAESQGIHVGDSVRASGTEKQFVVRGIVPTPAEAGLHNLFAAALRISTSISPVNFRSNAAQQHQHPATGRHVAGAGQDALSDEVETSCDSSTATRERTSSLTESADRRR
jgi:hypothetical protein